MEIKIKLRGNCANGKFPKVRLSVNNVVYVDAEISEISEHTLTIDPLLQNVLSIEHYNKTNDDTIVDDSNNIVDDLSVELLGITIDNNSILHTVLHTMPFYVNWPENIIADYQEKDETPPKFITNNLYFGFNGVYKFNFTNNSDIDYFTTFWLDEAQAHANQTETANGEEVFKRMGETVTISKDSDFTIHDLKRMVDV
jgi:hypothetical protein